MTENPTQTMAPDGVDRSRKKTGGWCGCLIIIAVVGLLILLRGPIGPSPAMQPATTSSGVPATPTK